MTTGIHPEKRGKKLRRGKMRWNTRKNALGERKCVQMVYNAVILGTRVLNLWLLTHFFVLYSTIFQCTLFNLFENILLYIYLFISFRLIIINFLQSLSV